MLLKADCRLSAANSRSAPSLLAAAVSVDDINSRAYVSDAVVTALIDRHTRLLSRALLLLPAATLAALQIVPGELQEKLALVMVEELRKCNFNCPPALILDSQNVYCVKSFHIEARLPVQLAERLWDGGFQDIHSHQNNGLTPLLQNWLSGDFDMVEWLVSRGASPFSRHQDTQGSGLHLYYLRLGQLSAGVQFLENIKTGGERRDLLTQLMLNESCRHDSCACPCSAHGCTPISMYLKGALYKIHSSTCSLLPDVLLLGLLWGKLELKTKERLLQVDEILRFLVFGHLGLHHTCCFYMWFGGKSDVDFVYCESAYNDFDDDESEDHESEDYDSEDHESEDHESANDDSDDDHPKDHHPENDDSKVDGSEDHEAADHES